VTSENDFATFAVNFFTTKTAMMAHTCLPEGRLRKVDQKQSII
jgi:hypothetical protein